MRAEEMVASTDCSKHVSVELSVEEIIQIEEVLLRHRRTPLVIGLQDKMRDARRSVQDGKEKKGI